MQLSHTNTPTCTNLVLHYIIPPTVTVHGDDCVEDWNKTRHWQDKHHLEQISKGTISFEVQTQRRRGRLAENGRCVATISNCAGRLVPLLLMAFSYYQLRKISQLDVHQ